MSPKSTQTWLPVHTFSEYSDCTLRSTRLVMTPLESTPLRPVGLTHALIVSPVVPWSAAVLVKSTHALPEKLPTRPRIPSDTGMATEPVSRPPEPPQLLITGLPVVGHDASSIWALSAQPRARSIDPSGGMPSEGPEFWTLPQPAVSARTTSRRSM